MLVEMLQTQFNDTILNSNHTSNDILGDMEITSKLDETKKPKFPEQAIEIIQEIALLFDGELVPVAPKAQRKVPLPEGLDLDEWINPPPEDNKDSESSDSDHDKEQLFVKGNSHSNDDFERRKSEELPPEEIAKRKEARRLEQMHNPHYIKGTENYHNSNKSEYLNVDNIPIAELALEIPLEIQCKFFFVFFDFDVTFTLFTLQQREGPMTIF